MYTFMRNTQYLAPKWRAYVTPHDLGFDFGNGVVVGSMWDLKSALLTLEDSLINSHIQMGSNHIATWVRQIVGDFRLADSMIETDQRWGMVVALERQMMRTLNLPDYVANRWLKKSSSGFHFESGEEIFSLHELQAIFPSIAETTLSAHYERYPNDLSSWLSNVVGDYYLSDALEEACHKDQIQAIIEDHLAMLTDASLN